ncbi:MAG: isoprenylcysteine carboxylmethyltransferase family protein [Sphingopyxis sp.]
MTDKPMPATDDSMMESAVVSSTRPRSAVSSGVGVAGLVGLFGWFMLSRQLGWDNERSALASVVCTGLCMVLWSLFIDKVHRNPTTGIDWSLRRPWAEVHDITPTKLTGLWATWAAIAFAYSILRYYWSGQYAFSMQVLGYALVPMVLLSVPYVLWLDRHLVAPRDGAWHFGRWLLGGEDSDPAMIWKHWRAWVVKGFFTAFMISIVPDNFHRLVDWDWGIVQNNPVEFAAFGIGLFYLIDVHFATVGYVLTMRPLDAHIRTANPYGMGWVAALACYPPFALMNPGGPLFYEQDGRQWNWWFDAFGVALPVWWLWAAMLIVLTAVYAWATVAFGLRFSNLTHRGIITHGPYKYTRHPAYVAKNAFWWLSSLAILPWDESWITALRNTMLLSAISGIYYWRAKTEERHLLADPEYRAYWNWAQEHAPVPRFFRWASGLERPMIVLEPDERVGPVT